MATHLCFKVREESD
uniref:Uncharacterized protein n=1 Tax=Anguilla anguilla TaxID=7936 RepID=A0A0E9TG60_ANGAN